MSDKISKILSIALYVVMGLSVLFLILLYFEATDVGLLIYWTYLLLIIAAALAVVFPAVFMIRNPKGTKKVLISIGVLALIFLISYLVASNEVLPGYEKYGIGPAASKNVEMGLIATYLFGFGAIGAIIYSAVSRFFK